MLSKPEGQQEGSTLSELAAFWINRPRAMRFAPDPSYVQELEQDEGGVNRVVMGIVVVKTDDVVVVGAAITVVKAAMLKMIGSLFTHVKSRCYLDRIWVNEI